MVQGQRWVGGLTRCEDVRCQREREERRDPWHEVVLEDGADALDLGQFVTDAVAGDWRTGRERAVSVRGSMNSPGLLLAVPMSRSVGRIKMR